MVRAIVLKPEDNVATLIDVGKEGAVCRLQGEGTGTVALAADIPFGHKVAVREIAAGEAVFKYGQPIGLATEPIAVGAHVHVHNVESQRGRGDRATAG